MNKITHIDFSTGQVHWEIDGVQYSFPDLRLNASDPRGARTSALDFSGLSVAIAYQYHEHKMLSINSPDGYDFEKSEIWAPQLAERLSKICPKEIYPRNGQAAFEWGTIKLYTEWRDGGWGARFEYKT